MGNYEKAEGILDKYSKGKLSAREVQKELKSFGYKADLRGKSNTIPVYPIDGGDGFDVELAKGGAMLKKQMELFERVEGAFDEGGLMDEGGTVDPVSGNDVPIGSTQEEVRDDIPAQLSEGEFVFPADVVRYYGLETLMKMRQEAKQGLKLMDAMGQMGNSEEATIPDDIPFDINDLDMEDDGVLEYAQGGVVHAQQGTYVPAGGFIPSTEAEKEYGIAGYRQSQFYTPPVASTTTPTTQPPTVVQPVTPVSPVTTPQTTPTFVPSFSTFTGSAQPQPGGYDEFRVYVNEAGMEMRIPFKNGQPIYPIPAGYTPKGEAQTTTPDTTPKTTTSLPSFDSSGTDSDGPDLAKQQEYQQKVKERIDAAEQLGYTDKQTVVDALTPLVANMIVPGAGFVLPKPEAGTVLQDGTIADGQGNSFDPITGEKVGSSGGIVGAIYDKLTAKERSDTAKDMGLSPASEAGLKTIKGEQSIQDALDAAKDVKVETTQTLREGTTVEEAAEVSSGVKNAMEKLQETIDDAGLTGQQKDNFLDNVIAQREGSTTGLGKDGKTVDYSPEVTESLAADYQIAANNIKQGKSAEDFKDDSDDSVADSARRSTDRPTRTESLESRTDYQDNFNNYKSKGFSDYEAKSAASRKTRADDEARAQTGNPKATAVTDSKGNPVRSGTDGTIVVNIPPEPSKSSGSGRSGGSTGGGSPGQNSDGPSYDTVTGTESFEDYMSRDYADFAKGGLAQQMKQSGLASKK